MMTTTTTNTDQQVSQSETLRSIAESIARRGLPFSAFKDEVEREASLTFLTNEITSALRNERERAARIADGEAQEWSLVSGNYKAHDPMKTKAISRSAMAREIATAIREGR